MHTNILYSLFYVENSHDRFIFIILRRKPAQRCLWDFNFISCLPFLLITLFRPIELYMKRFPFTHYYPNPTPLTQNFSYGHTIARIPGRVATAPRNPRKRTKRTNTNTRNNFVANIPLPNETPYKTKFRNPNATMSNNTLSETSFSSDLFYLPIIWFI